MRIEHITNDIKPASTRTLIAEAILGEDYEDLKAEIGDRLYQWRRDGILDFDIGALVADFGGDREGMASLLADLPDIVKDVEDGVVHLKDGGYDEPEPEDMPELGADELEGDDIEGPPEDDLDGLDGMDDAGAPPEVADADDGTPAERPPNTIKRTSTASNPLVP